MAQIGQFTRTQSGYSGRIRTLSLDLAIVFVPVDNADIENAPDYRIRLGDEDGIEIGAGWLQSGDRAGTYISVLLDDPSLAHHIRLPDLEAAGDSAPGSIVELRSFTDTQGRRRVAIAVRSDLPIERQVSAAGATWLDRQAVSRDPIALGEGGFARDVQDALERRAEHLVEEGLAQRQGGRIVFARRLLDTLRSREIEALGEKLATDLGRPFNKAATGNYVAGTYSQRLTLASGRFAMIDDGLGFQLVPWTPSLDRRLGQHISGIARGDAGVDWSFSRKRGLGL